MKINWKWPAKPGGRFLPGYVILLRLFFAPIVYLGLALTFTGLLVSHGFERAMDWLKSAT